MTANPERLGARRSSCGEPDDPAPERRSPFRPTLLAAALAAPMAVGAQSTPGEAGALAIGAAEVLNAAPIEGAATRSADRSADRSANRSATGSGARSRGSSGSTRFERVGDHAVIEGDMLIGRLDVDGQLNSGVATRGFGHSRMLDRWPDGVVPYELDPSMTSDQRASVEAAIEHWTDRSRISFVRRGSAQADLYGVTAEGENWIQFLPEQGCASYVGRADVQPQPLYVQNCTVGSVIHEIGHAIGLYHEHTRPDRDNYIEVRLQNVIAGREHNFEILFANTQAFGEYDYDSIMHYGAYFFSDGERPTIVAPNGREIGQRIALSDGDVATVDRLYATDLELAVESRPARLASADGTEVNGLELDVQVRNIGGLGAHALQLEFDLGEQAEWLAVTENSGWECTTTAARLNCARPTLSEGDSSRFVLHLDPHGADAGTLEATLNSRTLDLDASNNRLSDDDGGALPVVAAATPEPEPGNDTSAAQPKTSTGTASAGQTAPSGGAAGGGGALGGGGLALLGLAVALGTSRRRRRAGAGTDGGAVVD